MERRIPDRTRIRMKKTDALIDLSIIERNKVLSTRHNTLPKTMQEGLLRWLSQGEIGVEKSVASRGFRGVLLGSYEPPQGGLQVR